MEPDFRPFGGFFNSLDTISIRLLIGETINMDFRKVTQSIWISVCSTMHMDFKKAEHKMNSVGRRGLSK